MTIIGFFSMYFLLKKAKITPSLSILVSVCYSVLPVVPLVSIAVSTLPLIINVFLYFAFSKNAGFSRKTLLLLFFPFFFYFVFTGIFILGFWFLGTVVLWIKNKKLNLNLLAGFIMLCIGCVLVDVRLFYMMFILKTPLNRSIFFSYPTETVAQIKTFLRELKNYGLNGFYHVTSFQRKYIIPVAFLVSLSCVIMFIKRVYKRQGKPEARIKAAITESSPETKMLFALEIAVFLVCCIAALYESRILNGFIKKYIPLLRGFNWGRVWIFNRVLWYIIFALCLRFILEIKAIKIFFQRNSEPVTIPAFGLRLAAGLLVLLQIGYVFNSKVEYNDARSTWAHFYHVLRNINDDPANYISYREFFAEWQFDKIKKDISYSGEKVAAYGYHPSVLIYNGFNSIDGHNSSYPLSYMRRFRTLIAPELEMNRQAREYYDSWGGRMYLYNAELSFFQPTRNKNTSPVALNIDMDVFKNDFGGTYILSRAEISNSNELGLELVNRYYDEESIYTIYLYKVY